MAPLLLNSLISPNYPRWVSGRACNFVLAVGNGNWSNFLLGHPPLLTGYRAKGFPPSARESEWNSHDVPFSSRDKVGEEERTCWNINLCLITSESYHTESGRVGVLLSYPEYDGIRKAGTFIPLHASGSSVGCIYFGGRNSCNRTC